LPGWEIPKLTPGSYSKDYGFITDYFCEIMHDLRKTNVLDSIKLRFELIDRGDTEKGISGRDHRAVMKTLSGLMKMLYPHGKVTDSELEEILSIACELRQRVQEQLQRMAPGEYERVKIGAKIHSSNKIVSPFLPDSEREQKIALPERPSIGEVIGLGVAGYSCLRCKLLKGAEKLFP
jgi:ATP-dependent Lon protease